MYRIQSETSSDITTWKLKNGLKVYYKQTEREPGEFDLQMFSVGGYASLPRSEHVSAWLSTEIARESGLNSLSGDQMICALDDRSLEFEMKIGMFDRSIQISGKASELTYGLKLIHSLFTAPQFNEKGLKKTVSRISKKLSKIREKRENWNRDLFLKINFGDTDLFSPISEVSVRSIDPEKSAAHFKNFFSNPAEFTLVLVGDLEPSRIMASLKNSLDTLPALPIISRAPLFLPEFSKTNVNTEISGFSRYKPGLTRLTFPLKGNTYTPTELNPVCAVLKKRLSNALPDRDPILQTLKIYHEFPLFPYLDETWIVIRFSSPRDKTIEYRETVLKTLACLRHQPITKEEFHWACRELASQKPIMMSNAHELSLIADYCKAGWNLHDIYCENTGSTRQKKMFKKIRNRYPKVRHYSTISLYP